MENKPLYFKIRGMDCAKEVAILKREVGPLVGGDTNLTFDILNAKMGVTTAIDADAIASAVAKTGMRADLWRDDGVATPVSFWTQHSLVILTPVSGVLLVAGFLTHAVSAGSIQGALGSEGLGVGDGVPLLSRVLYGVGILSGLWLILPKAFHALKRLRPDMNLLMVVAVAGAILIGEWIEGATVAFLFAVSLTLESWSVGRARRAVAKLLELAPTIARVRQLDGTEVEVPAKDVSTGSIFVVRPGEKVALDGSVVTGSSEVNQAPITGESMPASKKPGDSVFAGTINGDGLLEVRSSKPASDTTLARIIRMVGEAQARRAPADQWVEKFARVYTPAVMLIAFLVIVVPPMLFGKPWSEWVYRGLVLLVIGCPCALVISTPVSIVAALTAAAKHGVLIKGGAYVELPAHLRAIAMDKTGTLTQGKPVVVQIVPLSGHTEKEVIERAASMEVNSDHPIAQAIVDYAKGQGVSVKPVSKFEIIKGKGATAQFDDRLFWLGSHRYLEERKQETPEVHAQLEQMTASGRTIVVVGNDQHVCGFIALSDAIRPTAKQTMSALHAAGIEHIVMLTGDNKGTADIIAKQTDIDEVRAELLPEGKVTAIEELLAMYGQVAMVGDGVNDAPALGRASVGIAMGAIGSDASIETADIALMSDDISKLPWLIQHSRRTLRIIRQNIFFSLAVKVLFVSLTIAGHASLWSAIAADMGASLLVIFNALRLLRD